MSADTERAVAEARDDGFEDEFRLAVQENWLTGNEARLRRLMRDIRADERARIVALLTSEEMRERLLAGLGDELRANGIDARLFIEAVQTEIARAVEAM